MENSRRCEICNVDVHRASMQKHLRSKKHFEKEKQNEMIVPEWLFKEEQKPDEKDVFNPKKLKQITPGNIKIFDKELGRKLAEKMNNPYYFIVCNLKLGFKIILESHNISHANSILTNTPTYSDFGIETKYINKILQEMGTIYAGVINQYKFEYRILFSASFYKINEEDRRSDENELFINFNINHSLTEHDNINNDVTSQLEHQIEIQQMKESGWIFDKKNSMKIRFYKTGELNGSNYVKILLRSNAIKTYDKYCSLWSILAYIHSCEKCHLSKERKYITYFNDINIECFDFTNGFRFSDVHKFEKLNKISINIFELNIYQDQNKRKTKLIPTEISKNDEPDRVVDNNIQKSLGSH